LKILVTGAQGFTGVHFTQAARALKHEVIALAADLTDAAAVNAEVAQAAPQAVVHLAGISFVGHADDTAFYAVNTVGTATLLGALCALPVAPTKVLIASSATVYGNSLHSPISENASLAPANHYAASKVAMELMAQTFADKLAIVIARPFNYTGVGQNASFLIPKLVNHFVQRAKNISLGNIHVKREFNDVAMVCGAYLHLLDHGEPGQAYNVCTGEMHDLMEVLALLQEITGHALNVEINPAFVRANEIHQLCGDASKIRSLLAAHEKSVQPIPLSHTLKAMLSAAQSTASRENAPNVA
jgi:nucleoside-diphosphate-sugar epimerase